MDGGVLRLSTLVHPLVLRHARLVRVRVRVRVRHPLVLRHARLYARESGWVGEWVGGKVGAWESA